MTNYKKQITNYKAKLLAIILLFNSAPHVAAAENIAYAPVVISEIAAQLASDYEWIEVCNVSDISQDLTGWKFYEEKTNHSLTAFQNDLILDLNECAVIASKADNFKESHPDYLGTILDSSWTSLKVEGEEIGLKRKDLTIVELFTYPTVTDEPISKVDLNSADYTAGNWMSAAETPGVVYELTTDNSQLTIISEPTIPEVPLLVEEVPLSNEDPVVEPEIIEPIAVPIYEDPIVEPEIPQTPIVDEPTTNDSLPTTNSTVTNEQINNGTNDQSGDQVNNSIQATPGTILINEIVPYPAEGGEWIELYNASDYDFDLDGWKIFDGAGSIATLSGAISSHSFFTSTLNSAHLNNSGDLVILKDADGDSIDSITYGNWNDDGLLANNLPAPAKGNSLARTVDGGNEFSVTTTLTKNSPNIMDFPVPIIPISQPLTTNYSLPTTNSTTTITTTKPTKVEIANIIINELMPNPTGADSEGEYIELFNPGSSAVVLDGWKIMISTGGQYIIPALKIEPQGFVTLFRSQTRVALNNTSGTVKLYDQTGRKIDSVTYKGAFDPGYSYQLIEGDWMLTGSGTPNAQNVYVQANQPPILKVICDKEIFVGDQFECDASDSYDPEGEKLTFRWTFQSIDERLSDKFTGDAVIMIPKQKTQKEIKLWVSDGVRETYKKFRITIIQEVNTETKLSASTMDTIIKNSTDTSDNAPLAVELDDAKLLASGTEVISRGTVSVIPGTFGEKIFYLSGSGIEVTIENGEVPKIELGDYLEVTGTVRTSLGQKRIALQGGGGLTILEKRPPPSPVPVQIKNIGENYESYLINVTGKVVDLTGTTLALEDDGNQIQVILKRGAKITKTRLQNGDTIHLTAIVQQSGEQFQLLPRTDEDIEIEPPEVNAQFPITNVQEETQSAKKSFGGITSLIIAALAGLTTVFMVHRKIKKMKKIPNLHFSK